MAKQKTKKTKIVNKKARVKKSLKHWLIPHKGNKYHPHIIRWQGLALTAAVSLTTHLVYGYVSTGHFAVLGKSVTISTSQLQTLTNQNRVENGLNALELDSRLSAAATKKAEDMITNNYWSHNSPSGASPWYWIDQAGYSYSVAGENLAKNYGDAEAVMAAWMSSSTHRDNILNPRFTSVGFAVGQGVIDMKINTVVIAYYASPISEGAAVKGATTNLPSDIATTTSYNNPLIYAGGLIKNLSPATIGLLLVIMTMIIVASLSHLSKDYLPSGVRKSWKRHHGLYKAVGLSVVATIIIVMSSGSYI